MKVGIHKSDILIEPVITEKSEHLREQGKYTFWVHKNANKELIRRAVEDIFGVKVEKVHIINVKGKFRSFRTRRLQKRGRQADRKKAIITLKKDQKIDIFEKG